VSFTETEWLQKAQQRDDEAFTELVRQYQTPVYNLCYRMLGNPQEAEDAAQESFWRAYQAIDRYDPSRSFITWLLSIAAHYCIDQQRKRRVPTVEMDLETEFNAPDPAPTPEKALRMSEEKQMLQQVINTLNDQDRAVVVLRYWHELSEEEIGRTLNLTVSAVKSRLHRARKLLAERWLEAQKTTAPVERNRHESPAL